MQESETANKIFREQYVETIFSAQGRRRRDSGHVGRQNEGIKQGHERILPFNCETVGCALRKNNEATAEFE